ncbi:O-antigen polysaccharide polymerase Wzy [Micromonospora sp. NBC_01796]|uniref:O-antigen polysaccharide polymerase Wzy n=1 Tax=Micromonospora sp. NBC_01796 TaxID=2975987 RepID=UPI002DD92887|nr:O-antigen polysaccharide polymerase Wzy [Micromonospora sp. NBC_01796]WSA86383.1 O-antigen polysaccharide polymerase Wzy family protein [Micromonospora sp. NBC_01796]
MDLNSTTVIWACVAGAVAVPVLLLLRSGRRDVLPYLAGYFAFFGLGPALNHVLGREIYPGIAIDKIGAASFGLLLAFLAMLVVGVVVPVRRGALDRTRIDQPEHRLPLLVPFLLALALYALTIMALHGPAMLSGNKLDRITLAGPWHYDYLLLQTMACSLYFAARSTRLGTIAYAVNVACYVGYCLATNERDFLFALFSVLLHVQLFRRRAMSLRLALIGVAGVVLATFLASIRSPGVGIGTTRALNEGTVMFPDTYVMSLVPHQLPFAHGGTYWDAVQGVLPIGPQYALAQWLVDSYAPGSPGGYGFSLTAEAYLNFGLVGIPLVFAALTAVQRFLVNRAVRGGFYTYASVLFTVTWMYNFRGESFALVKTLVYGAVLYGILHLSGKVLRTYGRDRKTSAPVAGSAAGIGARPGRIGAAAGRVGVNRPAAVLARTRRAPRGAS